MTQHDEAQMYVSRWLKWVAYTKFVEQDGKWSIELRVEDIRLAEGRDYSSPNSQYELIYTKDEEWVPIDFSGKRKIIPMLFDEEWDARFVANEKIGECYKAMKALEDPLKILEKPDNDPA